MRLRGGETTSKKQISFRFERATKNMYRFREDSPDPVVGTLYMNKRMFENGSPDKINVTIEW